MKERGMLFSGEMVRAVLDGRKSQTRRIMKLNASGRVALAGKNWHVDDPDAVNACPHGVAGDRIWCRETFHINKPKHSGATGFVSYRADGEKSWKWIPSIHMPRWASRITLEIKSVRVERLQSISESDAMAEGWNFNVNEDPLTWFSKLWDKINVKPGTRWADNPWVFVIEFRNISVRR